MPGFDFSNYNRNAALHARGVPLPKATSTGTTIVGCIFDGGVVVSKASFQDCPSPLRCTCSSSAEARLSHYATSTTRTKASHPLTHPPNVTDRSRHPCHLRPHRRRQELREAALHRAADLVCRRWYRSRHRVHHSPHLLQPGATLLVDRP